METIETLLSHRSIRQFKEQPIEDEILDKILQAACNGSTLGGMQLFSIIVTKDKAMMEKMAPMHFNQPIATNAPLILTFCADFHRFDRFCECRDVPTDAYSNFQAYQWAVTDSIIAAQNACVAAESFGLGLCWLGTITYNVPQFIEILQLPKHVIPTACIAIGYPDQQIPLTTKLPVRSLIHQESYRDYNDTDINNMYAALEKDTHNATAVAENKTGNLANDYVSRRYKKEDNEYFSNILYKAVKEQGF